MAARRRTGSENSKTRTLLLDATERLTLNEGYAAVGVRRVAREAGVTPALVSYYFATLDDLFLAVLRRRGDEQLELQRRALDSDRPLRALWEFSSLPEVAAFTMEFTALGNHRKAIRTEIARYGEQLRAMQVEALGTFLAERGIDGQDVPPVAVLFLMTSVSRIVTMESALGMTLGHAEARGLVEQFLQRAEGSETPDQAGRTARA